MHLAGVLRGGCRKRRASLGDASALYGAVLRRDSCGGRSHTAALYGYEKAWSAYVTDLVRCVALPCGHYPAEQAPEETYTELRAFFAS